MQTVHLILKLGLSSSGEEVVAGMNLVAPAGQIGEGARQMERRAQTGRNHLFEPHGIGLGE